MGFMIHLVKPWTPVSSIFRSIRVNHGQVGFRKALQCGDLQEQSYIIPHQCTVCTIRRVTSIPSPQNNIILHRVASIHVVLVTARETEK